MAKKCIICEDPARYKIKNTSDFYCTQCAKDNFSDVNMLLAVEEEATLLKRFIDES
ncbi:TPA: hypothetical protein HA278_05265 [Candidatus Woesearchaeota archaeon]|nr:hypothetical protein [Candidatus Woesearchaeota archaeon]|tara:strand:- start:722 stop:889 length:168 start_codon:yes stop_codon:yes gene_type:complete